ncbi:MAG TPA: hypothetical protein VMA34_03790 [Terracidiphilus sp.]|nr:hypothetical protein [Terracidiphilus sp.]
MRKLAVCFCFLFLVPVFAAAARVQDASKPSDTATRSDAAKPPAHFYRLNFVLEELDLDGKPVNSRSFSTTVSTAGSRYGSVVVGTKIPLVTGSETSKNGRPDDVLDEFQYVDTGVKINTNDVREDGDRLTFSLHAEVSSAAAPVVLLGVSEPVLRQNVWSGDVLIPVGKPTIVFKSDSLDSKGSMELTVTATPVE